MAQMVILVRNKKCDFHQPWWRRLLNPMLRSLKEWAIKYGEYLVESGYYRGSGHYIDWLD